MPPVSEIQQLRDERDRLRNALLDLVNTLRMIHADRRYQAVWELAIAHGVPYTGPTYDRALNAAIKVLRNLPLTPEPDAQPIDKDTNAH